MRGGPKTRTGDHVESFRAWVEEQERLKRQKLLEGRGKGKALDFSYLKEMAGKRKLDRQEGA